MIELWVSPDGHVVRAKVYRSSGFEMIDRYALQKGQLMTLRPFSDQVARKTRVFLLPVEITTN